MDAHGAVEGQGLDKLCMWTVRDLSQVADSLEKIPLAIQTLR